MTEVIEAREWIGRAGFTGTVHEIAGAASTLDGSAGPEEKWPERYRRARSGHRRQAFVGVSAANAGPDVGPAPGMSGKRPPNAWAASESLLFVGQCRMAACRELPSPTTNWARS